jgi:hypothetical protein
LACAVIPSGEAYMKEVDMSQHSDRK